MTILYIDDDLEDRELFHEAVLSVDPGIIFHTAANGLEGLQILNRLEELPDFVFLDVNMPLMDGRECFTEMKKDQRFSAIPVIVYSTSSQEREIAWFLESGARDFIIKPAIFDQVCEIIERTITGIEGRTAARYQKPWNGRGLCRSGNG